MCIYIYIRGHTLREGTDEESPTVFMYDKLLSDTSLYMAIFDSILLNSYIVLLHYKLFRIFLHAI